jgi:hypothetical protein
MAFIPSAFATLFLVLKPIYLPSFTTLELPKLAHCGSRMSCHWLKQVNLSSKGETLEWQRNTLKVISRVAKFSSKW